MMKKKAAVAIYAGMSNFCTPDNDVTWASSSSIVVVHLHER